MESKEELRARWGDNDIAKGMRALQTGGTSPFQLLENGLRDFRGFAISEPLEEVKICSVDFSFALSKWFGQFTYCTVDDCTFVESELDANFGQTFRRCKFDAARLKQAVFRGFYEVCSFVNCNLTGAGTSEGVFTRCNFTRANMRKAIFWHCRFVDCKFQGAAFRSGSLGGSTLVRTSLEDANLGNVILDHVKYADQ